jgi:5-methylcytosine-specific restriction endonuclease McrA
MAWTKEEKVAYMKAYRVANRERLQEQERLYRQTHADEVAARRKAYWETHRDKQIPQLRAYRQAHKEDFVAYRKNERLTQPDKLAARNKAYCEAHREELRAYRATRREETRINANNTRARKCGARGVFTIAEWRALCAWFNGACLCCGATEKLTIDHVVPLSKGGLNTTANIQILCIHCNKRKQSKVIDYRDPERFAAFLASLTAKEEAQ